MCVQKIVKSEIFTQLVSFIYALNTLEKAWKYEKCQNSKAEGDLGKVWEKFVSTENPAKNILPKVENQAKLDNRR